MPWNGTTGLIIAPVSIRDIKAAVGYNPLRLGELIRNGDINRWAKCKPFIYPAWAFASDSARLTARRSRNCGLVMRDYGSLWSVYSSMIRAGAGAGGWKWDYPGGGSSSPYRMLDFDGYDKGAGAPLQVGIYPSPAYKGDTPRLSDEGGAGTADILLSDLQGDGTNAVNHSNCKYYDISGLYLGVAFGHLTLSPDHAYTLGPVSSWTAQNIPAPGSTADYYVVPFLSDVQLVGDDPSSRNGVFIPAPIGMSLWNYYAYFPFVDRGTYQDRDVTPIALYVRLKVEVLQTRSYTSLGVQFSNDGTTWSPTETIYSTSGTMNAGDLIQTNVILRSGYTTPTYFRMVLSGTADTRHFTIATSPTL